MSGLTQVSLFLQVAVQMGTPILFGTLGGILCEKSGNINLGVEGMMLMGAVFGFMTALHTGNPFLTIAVAGLAGAFGALIYAVITVTLRGNHTVTGLALTIFGTGLSGTLGKPLAGLALPNSILRAFSPTMCRAFQKSRCSAKCFSSRASMCRSRRCSRCSCTSI